MFNNNANDINYDSLDHNTYEDSGDAVFYICQSEVVNTFQLSK